MVTGMVLQDLNSLNKTVVLPTFDPERFRREFPALSENSVYLDSASTSLKPQTMIDAVYRYYIHYTATTKRSLHQDAQKLTVDVELARELVADFIHAQDSREIVWTRGATESINLIAQSYARSQLQSGDEIIVSDIEHHSNLLPWLIVAEQTGAKIVKWSSDQDELAKLLTCRTRIVCITQMSNVTGYCPDLQAISQMVHQYNAILVVDGAQGIVHHPIDVSLLNIDFYAFSAHKWYGPTGLGVLYGKLALLEKMPVWHGGGKMLKKVSFDSFQAEDVPDKFEAGTPNIAGILGFYATLRWMKNWDFTQASYYTEQLADYTRLKLSEFSAIQFYSVEQSAIISFNVNQIHHNDLAILLSEQNMAIRTGELCAQPLMDKLGCQGVMRISLMPYNQRQDIDHCMLALKHAIELLIE